MKRSLPLIPLLLGSVLGGCEPSVIIVSAPPFLEPPTHDVDPSDGWDAPPGSGVTYVVNNFAIAAVNTGFDLDDQCGEDGCVDNVMWQLGELGNDQIRQGLLGGESLLLVEVAGLGEPHEGDDSAVAFKLYGASDADDPFFPANNFKVPPGHTRCCEFKISHRSLEGTPPQASGRIRASVKEGRLTALEGADVSFVPNFGDPPHPVVELKRAQVSGRVKANGFSSGLIGGVMPVSMLSSIKNPYCKTVSPRCPTVTSSTSTLFDLIVSSVSGRPDGDLDGDGVECLLDVDGDGAIELCCDGGGCDEQGCLGEPVPAIDPANPASCALHPRMADGYSIGFTFTGVRADVVGVGGTPP